MGIAVTNAENTAINEASIYADGVIEAITGSLDEPINSGGNQLLAIGGGNHSAVQPNGNVDITWSGPPADYAVDYSFDMSTGSWIELTDSATIAARETTKTTTDNFIAPNQNPATIYYRVKVPE